MIDRALPPEPAATLTLLGALPRRGDPGPASQREVATTLTDVTDVLPLKTKIFILPSPALGVCPEYVVPLSSPAAIL